MIKIEREPADMSNAGPYERCCFCRNPTPFWHTPKDVAVCPHCAAIHEESDVPTKAEWCRT